MSISRLRSRTGQGGFTLIELLVVVLIIGILASIAIPAFIGQKRKAQDQAAKSLLRSGAIATESYYAEQQNFGGLSPFLLSNEEQNVDWIAPPAAATDPYPQSVRNQVAVRTYGPGGLMPDDSYVMFSRSRTGTVFSYVRDSLGKVYRCSGTTEATTTLTGCTGTYAGGW